MSFLILCNLGKAGKKPLMVRKRFLFARKLGGRRRCSLSQRHANVSRGTEASSRRQAAPAHLTL